MVGAKEHHTTHNEPPTFPQELGDQLQSVGEVRKDIGQDGFNGAENCTDVTLLGHWGMR